MPFQIGQVVTCVDANTVGRIQNLLSEGERYTITYVSPRGAAVQVADLDHTFLATRFVEAPVPPFLEHDVGDWLPLNEVATAVIVEDIEAQPPPPLFQNHLAYDIHPFFGCCGACVIYAKYRQITEQSLREVLERRDEDVIDDSDEIITYGNIKNISFIILNEDQHTRASQDALGACGFRFLTTSEANGGGTLYTYALTQGRPIPFTPIERNRAF